MKNTILIILISLFSLSCRAQIYNLNDKTVSRFKVPAGSYFKDIDGDFDKYLGTMERNLERENTLFRFKKSEAQVG